MKLSQNKMFKKLFISILMSLSPYIISSAQPQPDLSAVEKVLIVFKTHLDVGYTDLSSKVEQRYITEFIPRAIEVNDQLRAEGSSDRYIWTTGSWLIDAYLKTASSEAVTKLEEAIRRGDIVWNGVPYTFESEGASRDVFEYCLKLAKRLDKKYGKTTVAAKMTDVPGHTRGVVSALYDAGFRFLHIGVNPASKIPEIPSLCRWRNIDGKEIILMYAKDYGDDAFLPGGKTVFSVKFTGDNHGPHKLYQVKNIYADMRKRYPNAEVVAATLNDVATELLKSAETLPVIASEIGDTWIYGYASDPLMMARFRAMSRLFTDWLKSGKLAADSDLAIDFAVKLGLVAEHTWGISDGILKDREKYEVDAFTTARNSEEFRFAELSWKEKADRVNQAIALLPPALQTEANEALANIGQATPLTIEKSDAIKELTPSGAFSFERKGVKCVLGEVTYQTYSSADFNAFYKAYTRGNYAWAISGFGKPGLDKTKAKSATLVAAPSKTTSRREGKNRIIDCILKIPEDTRIDARVLPQQINTEYVIAKDGRSVELSVSLVNKPEVRMPEAYWVSFFPQEVTAILVDKLGFPVDVMDVVKGGNRQMHAIDNYVDVVTAKGTLRITSLDAPVVATGERRALNYSVSQPDLDGGIHFCLFNNLWGTNFTMWWGGNLTYRFKIERL
jgi:hypothetical protein